MDKNSKSIKKGSSKIIRVATLITLPTAKMLPDFVDMFIDPLSAPSKSRRIQEAHDQVLRSEMSMLSNMVNGAFPISSLGYAIPSMCSELHSFNPVSQKCITVCSGV